MVHCCRSVGVPKEDYSCARVPYAGSSRYQCKHPHAEASLDSRSAQLLQHEEKWIIVRSDQHPICVEQLLRFQSETRPHAALRSATVAIPWASALNAQI